MLNGVTCIITSATTKKSYPNLKKCVNSLIKSSKAASVKINIIIAANNKINLFDLKNKIDLVFKVGNGKSTSLKNNLSLEVAYKKFNQDYFLFINDDAWVKNNFFAVFKSVIKKSRHDVIIPLVKKTNLVSIESFGTEYFRSGYAKNSVDLKLKTSLAANFCILVHSSLCKIMLNKFGFYYNTLLETYYDDLEFCIRALAVGGVFYKCKKLIAYHVGSFTYGYKSKYVVYQSYRNVLWVIVMCWPLKNIIENSLSILLVQIWFLFNGVLRFGPLFSINLIRDTVTNLSLLIQYRKVIISNYNSNFIFNSLLSSKTFRTKNGIVF